MTEIIVNGIIIGAGYATVAVGWTVLLGAARVVNFAHGQLYMLAAFVCWWASERLGVGYVAAGICAVALLAVIGGLAQLALMRLTLEQNLLGMMIATLGFGYMLQGGSTLLFGGAPRRLESPLDSEVLASSAGVVTLQDAAIVAACALLFALVWYVLARSPVGARVRAVAEDPQLAQLYGFDPRRSYIGLFAFSGAAVALSAVLLAPQSPILTTIGFEETVITFAIVVVGGVGSVLGSLGAGLGLGLFTSAFGSLVSPAYTTAAAFAVVLVLLVARPSGWSRG